LKDLWHGDIFNNACIISFISESIDHSGKVITSSDFQSILPDAKPWLIQVLQCRIYWYIVSNNLHLWNWVDCFKSGLGLTIFQKLAHGGEGCPPLITTIFFISSQSQLRNENLACEVCSIGHLRVAPQQQGGLTTYPK
jgi:hypothetical protein